MVAIAAQRIIAPDTAGSRRASLILLKHCSKGSALSSSQIAAAALSAAFGSGTVRLVEDGEHDR
jgi:hypothetical protein